MKILKSYEGNQKPFFYSTWNKFASTDKIILHDIKELVKVKYMLC